MEFFEFCGEFIIPQWKKLFDHLDIIIPTALTIYGWRLVYREGNRLAKRNETFNLSQIARKVLENISDESESIYNSTQHVLSDVETAKLTAYVAEFELCIGQICKHYGDVGVTSRDIFLLRRALTAFPYVVSGKAATDTDRVKDIKTQISGISLKLLNSTYENINSKFA